MHIGAVVFYMDRFTDRPATTTKDAVLLLSSNTGANSVQSNITLLTQR